MVDVRRRRSSSRNFPYAALVLTIVATIVVLNPLQDRFRHQDNETTLLHQAAYTFTCFSGLPFTGLQKPNTSFISILGIHFQSTFQTTTFLVYLRLTFITEDWSTTNPFTTDTTWMFSRFFEWVQVFTADHNYGLFHIGSKVFGFQMFFP